MIYNVFIGIQYFPDFRFQKRSHNAQFLQFVHQTSGPRVPEFKPALQHGGGALLITDYQPAGFPQQFDIGHSRNAVRGGKVQRFPFILIPFGNIFNYTLYFIPGNI